MPQVSLNDWKDFIRHRPDAHILQTAEWGELKAAFGWEAIRVICGDVGVQLLFRRLAFGLTVGYIPKPMSDITIADRVQPLWKELVAICRQRRAVFLKVEPDAWIADQTEPEKTATPPRYAGMAARQSEHNIQPPRTIVVDLQGSEDDVLGRMKQKCRYNIRLAEKKGVIVRPWADLELFHAMMQLTGRRDGFAIHDSAYYRRAYDLFRAAGECELLVAEHEGAPLAALMVFRRGARAWYMYGASSDSERNRMPTYLLQWEALRWAKARGSAEYDLWGVPDENEQSLEANFQSRQGGLWGVYRFKRGFGGEVKRRAVRGLGLQPRAPRTVSLANGRTRGWMMQPFHGTGIEWNRLIAKLPRTHLLQTWDWAQVKAAYGWTPLPFIWDGAAAMVLRRQVISRGFAARLCILYIPKGPLLDASNDSLRSQVLDDLQTYARGQGAILLKIDPDATLGSGVPGQKGATEDEAGLRLLMDLKNRGWSYSSEQVQFRNTLVIRLGASTEELLNQMKQKTRYNIRLAERKGVHIRTGTLADLAALYRMYAATSVRDRFVIRSEAYYRTVWEAFMRPPTATDQPFAEPLIAEVDGEAVAAIFVFYFARRAYYLYGMSRDAHRDKMPNYLLQWEAIQRAKALGCDSYDLWGAPDEFKESDSMWGVYRFKEGLGGEVVRTSGAWDYPAHPLWYKVFTQLVPRVLNVMRLRGRAQTERALD